MSDPALSRPLNVLQVCDHLGWDGSRMHGVKRLFAWMLPRFDKARYRVSLVSLRKKDVSEDTLDSLGVDVSYLHRGKFDPATLTDLNKIIDRQQIDILHLHGYGATTFGRLAGAMKGVPTILHEHANLTRHALVSEGGRPLPGAVHRHRDCRVREHRRVRPARATRPTRTCEGRVPRRSARGVRTDSNGRRDCRGSRGARYLAGHVCGRHGDAVARVQGQHVSRGRRRGGREAASERAILSGGGGPAPAGARSTGAGTRSRGSIRLRRIRLGRGGHALGVRSERVSVVVGRDAVDRVRGAGDGEGHRGDRRRWPPRRTRGRPYRAHCPDAQRGGARGGDRGADG